MSEVFIKIGCSGDHKQRLLKMALIRVLGCKIGPRRGLRSLGQFDFERLAHERRSRVIKCHTTRVTQRRSVPLAVEAKLDKKIGPLSTARECSVTQAEEPNLPDPFYARMVDIPHGERRDEI